MSLVWWARNAQSPVGPVAPSDSLSVADPDGRKNDCTGFWTVWTACNAARSQMQKLSAGKFHSFPPASWRKRTRWPPCGMIGIRHVPLAAL